MKKKTGEEIKEAEKITEVIFLCDFKEGSSEESTLMINYNKDDTILLSRGPEKFLECTTHKVDRYIGFAGVAMGKKIACVYEALKRSGADFDFLSIEDIESLFPGEQNLDLFDPPPTVSVVEQDFIATYKKVYYGVLDKFFFDKKILYINGLFESASLRFSKNNVDCVYFSEEAFNRASEKRGIHSTPGIDYYFDEDDDEWVEILDNYDGVEHSFIFGKIYEEILEYKNKRETSFLLIGIGIIPDITSEETYFPQEEVESLDTVPLKNPTLANKHRFQIFFDGDTLVGSYIDHGRYVDIKPHSYDVKIPLYDVTDWKRDKYYEAFRHMWIIVSGDDQECFKERYFLPEGDETIIDVKNGYYYFQNQAFQLRNSLSSELYLRGGRIYDYKDPRPYWIRRMILREAGVNLVFTKISVEYMKSISMNGEIYDSHVSDIFDVVKENKISRVFELRNCAYNPLMSKIVYAPGFSSYLTYTNEKGVGVGVGVTEKGELFVDVDSGLKLVYAIAYYETDYTHKFSSDVVFETMREVQVFEALEFLDEVNLDEI